MHTRTFYPSQPRFVLPRAKSGALGRKFHLIGQFRNEKKPGAGLIWQWLVGPFLGTKLFSSLQKRERTGTSFLYWLDWISTQIKSNATEWKATQPSLRVCSGKLFKWEPPKICKNSIQTLIILWFVYPYKLSILGDIWRATILPFSSSKYFYSW